MKLTELKSSFKKHKTAKDFVKIDREFEGEDFSLFGIILDNSKDFLLIQNDNDFQLDGFSIIPINTVASIRFNKTDKFHKTILEKEGVYSKDYGLNFKIDLKNWNMIFKSLKENNLVVSIEDETYEETYYIIGRIKRVNQKSVSIQYFDATGQLDEKLTKVFYDDISILTFGNRYINTYSKYLKEPIKTYANGIRH